MSASVTPEARAEHFASCFKTPGEIEIRSRCEAHDVEAPPHLLQHRNTNTKDGAEDVGEEPAIR